MNTAASSPTACKGCCLAVLARLNTRAQKWPFADEGDLQVVSPREATENCFNLATSNAMFRLETHVFRRGRLDFGWRLNGEASLGCAWPGLTRLEWKISYSSSWQASTRYTQFVLVARIRTRRRMQSCNRCRGAGFRTLTVVTSNVACLPPGGGVNGAWLRAYNDHTTASADTAECMDLRVPSPDAAPGRRDPTPRNRPLHTSPRTFTCL